jgi:predicted ATPase
VETVFLKQMQIKNFLSLHEVSLPFKPLTVLVGANGSGKSNILKTLLMLHRMMLREKLPDSSTIQSWTWAGDLQSQIDFKMEVESDDNRAIYHLVLQAERLIHTEELLVNDVKVISVQQGFGEIRDEDDKNPIVYSSDKLALKSAGDYGNKPVTHRLTNFIKNWAFFNFMPEVMRGKLMMNSDKPIQLDDEGTVLKHLLSVWHDNDYEKFELVSQSLADVTNLSLARIDDEEGKLGLLEGYEKPIPLDRASDGTLRLLAYYTLLNQSDLPSLIAIEEPERNFHPAALIRVASLIEELAQKTQVIVTTHSAQFLDAFDKDSLGDNLGVLLLQNHKGTSIIDFEEEQNRRDALNSWIKDFGIGSAIFDSELLEKSFCQV